MRSFLTFLLAVVFTAAYAQLPDKKPFERKGFIFGTALGFASISQTTASLPTRTQSSWSFPNFKVGAMVSRRTALVLHFPGAIYTYKGVGRPRDRGFEAIVPAVQFWWKERWWIMGGAGLALDAPAFYDIKSEEERKFYFGPSALAGLGFEVWRKGKFALDIQSRVHYGSTNVPEGTKKGVAFSLLLGFNWY